MKLTFSAFAMIAGLAFATGADARYLCDNPPSRVDRLACEAAEEGPDALRRLIERMRPAQSLYFYDYVTEAKLIAWQERDARERLTTDAQSTTTTASARHPAR